MLLNGGRWKPCIYVKEIDAYTHVRKVSEKQKSCFRLLHTNRGSTIYYISTARYVLIQRSSIFILLGSQDFIVWKEISYLKRKVTSKKLKKILL